MYVPRAHTKYRQIFIIGLVVNEGRTYESWRVVLCILESQVCNFSLCILDEIFRSQNSVRIFYIIPFFVILIENKGYINLHSIETTEILRRIDTCVCVHIYIYIYFACSLTFYLKSIFVDFLFLRHLVAERWWFNTSKVKWETWSVKNSIGGEIQQF